MSGEPGHDEQCEAEWSEYYGRYTSCDCGPRRFATPATSGQVRDWCVLCGRDGIKGTLCTSCKAPINDILDEGARQ